MHISSSDVSGDFFIIGAFKWRFAMQHFVEKNAKRPDVNCVIVVRVGYNFRSHILVGAAESLSFLVDVFCTPAEVTKLNIIIAIEKDIFWLNVAVEDIVVVEELDSFTSLDEELASLLLF
jgi:hypothetical protein